MEAYVETPYRMKIILYYVNSITITTCNYCIRWYRLCGFLLSPSAFVCLQTCLLQAIWWTTLVWCAWFRWSWSQRVHRSATACFFSNAWTTSINFPVWYHRWWSNLGEFQRQENKTGLSYGLPRFLMMEFHVWQCLYLYLIRAARLSCLQIRHVWWKHVRCNNLSFDLVHCGGIGFSFSTSLLRQLPVNYSVFLYISGRSVLQIYEYGFTFSLQLAFLPFLTKFMNGLVKA